jgi:hypothetical protein
MTDPEQKLQGKRDRTRGTDRNITLSPIVMTQMVPTQSDEDHYPGGRIGIALLVGGFLTLAGFLLWDFVSALLFR